MTIPDGNTPLGPTDASSSPQSHESAANDRLRILFSVEAADPWILEAYRAFFAAMSIYQGVEVFATFNRTGESPEVLKELNVIDYACVSNQRFLDCARSVGKATDEETFKQAAAARVWSGPDQIIEKFAFFKTAVSLLQPDVVIGWNGMADIRLLARQAVQEAGIPYLYAEKGVFPESWYIDHAGTNAESSISPAHLSGNMSDVRRQRVLQFIETIAASGTSAWDQPARKGPSELRSTLGIPPAHTVVFFPGQVDDDVNITRFSTFQTVAQAVEMTATSLTRQTTLLVKPHPKSSRQSQQAIAEVAQRHPNVIVAADINIWDAIDACDMVVSINSTAAFEAALRGKKVIVLGDGILSKTGLVPKTQASDLASRMAAALQGSTCQVDLGKALGLVDYLVNEYYMFRDTPLLSEVAKSLLDGIESHPHCFTPEQLVSQLYCGSISEAQNTSHEEAKPAPLLSVVLTTCNRPDMLKSVLDGFASQTAPREKWEIVLVDDGSQPPARELVASFSQKFDVRYIYQENSGLASARNAGTRVARGSIVLFHDDDDLPDSDLVAEHIESHLKYSDENIAVLGHWDWDPSLTVTPLMHYITHEGGQYFGYDKMTDGMLYGPWKWWGGQISAKTSLLKSIEGPFDERFSYGYEDTELVCRTLERPIKVLYNSRAKNLILRPMTFEDFCRRCVRQGRAMYHLARKHPGVVVKRYGLEKVEEEYATHYQPNLQRWHDVLVEYEPVFNANPEPIINGTDPGTGDLRKHWALCFRGYMLKGYMEEASAAASAQSTMASPVTLKTTDAAGPAHIESLPACSSQPKATGKAGNQPILFICPALPRPDVGSSNVRVHHILNILVGQGRKVDLVYFGQNDGDQLYTDSWKNRINITHMPSKAIELARYIESPEHRPACVWMTNLWSAQFCESMYKVADWMKKTLPGIPLIVDTMDHHARKFNRKFEYSHDAKDLQTAQRYQAVEAALYPLADLVITVTSEESKSIAQAVPGCSLAVVPNIHVPLEHTPNLEQRSNICFIGSLNIEHNADAVQWFINEVFPTVRNRLPDVEFHILGFGNDAYRQSLETHQGVKVIGYVPDAEAAVSRYRLLVCPLIYGAGLKGKLGTAACAGTPFVTTTIGAEGFGMANGADCFIVDMPAEFAAGCIMLYSDEKLWRWFTANIGQKFASAFSPAAVAPVLAQVLSNLGIAEPCTSRESAFSSHIAGLRQTIRPAKVIEASTCVGAGATSLIATAPGKMGLDTTFPTIKASPAYHSRPIETLKARDLDVRAVSSLSVKDSTETPRESAVRSVFKRCLMCSGIFLKCNGKLTCWCNSGYDLELGDIRSTHVGEFLKGPLISRIRESFKSGSEPFPRCGNCIARASDHYCDDNATITIHVEPTNMCQLRCEHCTCTSERNMPNGPKREMLDFDLYSKALTEIAETSTRIGCVAFCGYGEPLLNPRLPEMARLARRLFPNAHIYADTNANFQPQKALAAADCGLGTIQIALDGSDQTSYEGYRRCGDFSMALEFTRTLVNAIKASGSRTKPVWKYILFSHNDSDSCIRTAISMARDIGIEIIFHLTSSSNKSQRTSEEIGALIGSCRVGSNVDIQFRL